MSKLELFSTISIAVAILATPALTRENQMTSPHLTRSVDANTIVGVGQSDRPRYGNPASGLRGELGGYWDRDVWGHWGGYYGPMVSVP